MRKQEQIELVNSFLLKKCSPQLKRQLNEHLLSNEKVQSLIQMIPGIDNSSKDSYLLQDIFGSIRNIAQATAEEILSRTPCKRETAVAVEQFFSS
jgi:excinuclease UvrABC nuclease subunit